MIDRPTKIGTFDGIESFYVIDLDERWDVILGIGWLEKLQFLIGWRSNNMYMYKSLRAALAAELSSPELTVISNERTRDAEDVQPVASLSPSPSNSLVVSRNNMYSVLADVDTIDVDEIDIIRDVLSVSDSSLSDGPLIAPVLVK